MALTSEAEERYRKSQATENEGGVEAPGTLSKRIARPVPEVFLDAQRPFVKERSRFGAFLVLQEEANAGLVAGALYTAPNVSATFPVVHMKRTLGSHRGCVFRIFVKSNDTSKTLAPTCAWTRASALMVSASL